MAQSEQLTVCRDTDAGALAAERSAHPLDRRDPDERAALQLGRREPDERAPFPLDRPAPDERAARDALRKQIARLERELSELVARTFPHVRAHDHAHEALSGPRLLSLGELERVRDALVVRVGRVGIQARERAEHERRSHALLERMKLEPGRYKFARLPVADLGGGCGAYVVRPRLGLIGMLAGWWQVKLSSGCP